MMLGYHRYAISKPNHRNNALASKAGSIAYNRLLCPFLPSSSPNQCVPVLALPYLLGTKKVQIYNKIKFYEVDIFSNLFAKSLIVFHPCFLGIPAVIPRGAKFHSAGLPIIFIETYPSI